MMTDSNFKYGINLYLSRFTIGLVYEGVKEILLNKAEIDVFLELSCFFHDPADVWQLDLWFLCLF